MNEVEIRVGARDDTAPATRSVENRLRGLRRVGVAAGAGLAAAGAGAGAMFASGLAANMNIEVANDKLAAQLGLTTEQAKKAGEVAGDVYANNWGGSIEEVNSAIKSVGDNIGNVGNMSKEELQGMTESALALASTFDLDVNESTKAAGQLMKNGLAKDSTEAFDLITAGMQRGLNRSDDFLDTLGEYAPQFAKLGFSGAQSIGLLSSFLNAGARDTDVAADALKEFSILAVEKGGTASEAFKEMGFNAKDMALKIGKGGEGAVQGLDQVVRKLQEVKDPVEQNRLGVMLFGTQWEDTVRTILPKLDITESAIEGVDGATKRMADTVGDNAQGKIDTMKRSFEQWTQKMASSEGTLGTVVTGVTQFGGGAMAAGSQIAVMAIAMGQLNLAMLANPIGLVVAAIALLVVGMVALWKNSQKAREIMSTAFAGISTVVLTQVEVMLRVFRELANGVLFQVEVMLRALGKIPGNDWADRAADDVKGFRDDSNRFFDGAIKKTVDWKKAARAMPTKIKLQGDERDLSAKLRSAQRQLKALPRDKRTRVLTDISNAQRAIARVRAGLRGIQDRYINVYVSEVQRDRAMAGRGGKASGGIIGAATGGARGSWTMVGEQGRELVRLPFGSQVIPNGTTENMMRGPGSGAAQTITLIIKGTGVLEGLREVIRIKGGDVQKVMGTT